MAQKVPRFEGGLLENTVSGYDEQAVIGDQVYFSILADILLQSVDIPISLFIEQSGHCFAVISLLKSTIERRKECDGEIAYLLRLAELLNSMNSSVAFS